MNTRNLGCRLARPAAAVAAGILAALMPPSTAAFDFALGADNDIKGSWNTTVSIASGWRLQNRDPALYAPQNGNLQGLPTGTGANADDGNLKYGKGDNFITVAAFTSALELSKGGYGGLVRFTGWYDYTQKRSGVPHGNEANNYVAGEPLSDRGFEPLARFDGLALLDIYGYGNWKLGEDDLRVQVGRQVLNWGKGLLLQGVDQINPIEINTLRRPGTLLKEALLPVGMVYGNLGTAGGTTVEAFYQFQWEPTVFEGCGTYFSSIDAQISPNTANSGCPAAVVNAPDPVGFPAAAVGPLRADGQAARWRPVWRVGAPAGETTRYRVRAVRDEHPLPGPRPQRHPRRRPVPGERRRNRFGESAREYGPIRRTSRSTVQAPRPGSPAGRWVQSSATPTMSRCRFRSAMPLPASSIRRLAFRPRSGVRSVRASSQRRWAANSRPTSAGTRRCSCSTRCSRFKNVLGAQSAVVGGELGFSWSSGLDDSFRYGRGYVFGIARSPTYGPFNDAVAGGCPLLNSPNQPGCEPDGFFTPFAWGYRLRAQLNYANVADSGVTVSPNLFWLQDVKGYSVDYQFIQGRKTLGLGVNFAFPKRVNLGLLYAWYADDAQWNPTRDRDFVGVRLSASF